MAKHKRTHAASKESRDIKAEASKLVRSLNISHEDKEVKQQIVQGVQKVVEAYMRQQSEKTRDLDRRIKQFNKQQNKIETTGDVESQAEAPTTGRKLPWVLLVISWFVFLLVGFYLLGFVDAKRLGL